MGVVLLNEIVLAVALCSVTRKKIVLHLSTYNIVAALDRRSIYLLRSVK